MILYAKYKAKLFILESSTGYSILLLASRICTKLLLAKKNQQKFWIILKDSRIFVIDYHK